MRWLVGVILAVSYARIDSFRLGASLTRPSQRRCADSSSMRMSTGADFYTVLGVERDVSPTDLKKAYKRAAIRSHPDVNTAPDAPERFKAVVEAYQTLSDSKERAKYDRSSRRSAGASSPRGARPRPPPPGARPSGAYGASSRPGSSWEPPPRSYPQYDEDADGDSFTAIFSDLYKSVSERGVKGGGRAVLEDLLDYFEKSMEEMDDDPDDEPWPSSSSSRQKQPPPEPPKSRADSASQVNQELERMKREMGL